MDLLTPGQLLHQTPGLTRDKLEYYVRAGYVNPVVDTRGGRNYRTYSKEDSWIIRRAHKLIAQNKIQVRAGL